MVTKSTYSNTKGTDKSSDVSVCIRITLRIILIFALLFTLLFTLGFLPWEPVAVATGSMEPFIAAGDLVIIYKTANEGYQIGDVVEYSSDSGSIVHRIVSRKQNENGNAIYTMKGDSNNVADGQPVTDEDIIGKVVCVIPRLGNVRLWFAQK